MSKRLQVLISEALDSRVAKAAQLRGLSKGEWVRRAIERALDDDAEDTGSVAKLARLGGPTGSIGQMLAEIESGRTLMR
jgi:hypothetical protein